MCSVVLFARDKTVNPKSFDNLYSQGTLMALAAFSQDKLLNAIRSASLLCPIAYLGRIPSSLARAAAMFFLAEVRQTHPRGLFIHLEI